MTSFAARLKELRQALAGTAPATQSGFAAERYPGLEITRAPAAPTAAEPLLTAAFEAAGWPEAREPIPMVSELSEEQRALADVIAGAEGLSLHRWAIPQAGWARRRWLGIEAPGVLDGEVELAGEGEPRRVPLWRALGELRADREAATALFRELPVAARLEAWGDLIFGAYRVDCPWRPEGLGQAGRDWAPAYADRLLALFAEGAPHGERGGYTRPPDEVCRVVMRALIEAGLPIEERWDRLMPLDLDLIARLPPPRREAVLVRGLEDQLPTQAIRSGLEALARFALPGILEHLLERADRCYESLMLRPRRELAAQIRQVVAEEPALVERVDAYVGALPELPELRCTRMHYPTSVDELTEGQRAQLAILGQGWETEQGPMVWHDDGGEIEFGPLEFVSAYEIAGADGEPAFEALLYMDEDGAVCRAGTTKSVAYVCQMGLSWNIDVETVEALHAILRERPPRRR